MIIRDLSGMEEFFKAEQLQRDVWGAKGAPWTMNVYIIPPLALR